ncbi:hypothetical protein Trydic_g4807 [Trypoxylus dichotomus]
MATRAVGPSDCSMLIVAFAVCFVTIASGARHRLKSEMVTTISGLSGAKTRPFRDFAIELRIEAHDEALTSF